MGSERQKEGGWGEEKESTCMHVQLVLGTSANISSLKRVCSAFAEVLIVSDLLCSWFINKRISGTWLCCFTSPVTASSKPHFIPSIIHPPHEGFFFLSSFFFFLAVAVTELQHPLRGKRLPTESFLCSDFSQRTHEAYFVATYGQGGMHIFLKLCTFKTGNCVTSAALFFFFFP